MFKSRASIIVTVIFERAAVRRNCSTMQHVCNVAVAVIQVSGTAWASHRCVRELLFPIDKRLLVVCLPADGNGKSKIR